MAATSWCISLPSLSVIATCNNLQQLTITVVTIYYSNQALFLLAGLEVPNEPTWQARQAAYVTAVRSFLTKQKPEFGATQIVFVRNLRTRPRLFLIVECALPAQYVLTHCLFNLQSQCRCKLNLIPCILNQVKVHPEPLGVPRQIRGGQARLQKHSTK